MATKSFFTDMVIDTPEAAANLEALIEEGRLTDIDWPENYRMATDEDIEAFFRRFEEEHKEDFKEFFEREREILAKRKEERHEL
ncbi:MAG: hypothetical protein IKD00_03890 [Candidatus Methanomethylophilaceae archaeon]|nr:hypothetical protein [Candidatus Methanomethylophilaceae archaeon]